MNISAKSKSYLNILQHVNQGPRWVSFFARDSVTLRGGGTAFAPITRALGNSFIYSWAVQRAGFDPAPEYFP